MPKSDLPLPGAFDAVTTSAAAFVRRVKKAWALFRKGGFAAIKYKILAHRTSSNYAEWKRRYDTLTDADRDAIKSRVGILSLAPKISVLMPVHNVEEQWLRGAIDSIRTQLYPHWELCIVDDASDKSHIGELISKYSAEDSRIRAVKLETNSGISIATNRALEIATGEYVAFCDHDDVLTEHALYLIVEEINANPEVELIYSDEDRINERGEIFNPHFKSDWNPILLSAQNYLCHLCVYKTERLRALGGLRAGFDGAQDWDLALRAGETIGKEHIRHVPHVLYHWREISGSTARSTGYKPGVHEAQRQAVAEHLHRIGIEGATVSVESGFEQIRVTLPIAEPKPAVSIILLTRDNEPSLRRCVESIFLKSTYPNFEVLVIDNDSGEPAAVRYIKELSSNERVRVIKDRHPFSFAALMNGAVRVARGSVLAFINCGTEVISPSWLEEMVSYALLPQIGAVGAKLYYPNGAIQHAGMILGVTGVAGNSHRWQRRGNPGYMYRTIVPQNISAVTGACMVVRREVFEAVQGFDEQEFAVANSDIDFCLRLRERGLLNVFTPYAELYHDESQDPAAVIESEKLKRYQKEIEMMRERWGKALEGDPYYNPNLTLYREDFALAFPARAPQPWRTQK